MPNIHFLKHTESLRAMFLKHLNLRIIASHFFVKTKTWMRVPNLSSSNGVLPTAEDSGWFL